jgi:hypothetical protein
MQQLYGDLQAGRAGASGNSRQTWPLLRLPLNEIRITGDLLLEMLAAAMALRPIAAVGKLRFQRNSRSCCNVGVLAL